MKFQIDPTKRAAVTSVPKQLVDVPFLAGRAGSSPIPIQRYDDG
jgi:hypothetical protein